jgi:flagellar hook-associated protein 2
MSDVYIPGVKSRFNSEKLIEDLMKLERVPKERVERNVESLETQKGYWQEIGRRINSVRDSARLLYSFQNPFNERIALSGDEQVITAAATREAAEQDYRFTVKQTAQADRFLSPPLDEKMKIDSGTYSFSVGNEEISIQFRGGALKDFVDALNRRGRDKIGASLLAVQSGTKSLLIESKLTGSENRLVFSGDAAALAIKLGMMEQGNDSRLNLRITQESVRIPEAPPGGLKGDKEVSIQNGVLEVPALSQASLPFSMYIPSDSPVVLRLETATKTKVDAAITVPQPPPGPQVPSGSVTYGGITVENDPSGAPMPKWEAPAIPARVDNMAALSLTFSDGTRASLLPISDSQGFQTRQFRLSDVAAGKTITALNIENTNTHRDISLRGAEVFDPEQVGGLRPLNPVSTSRDAVITMEGIEMTRPSNIINDIIPGVTLTARGVSDRPVQLTVTTNREAVKDALISLVGNYNRLMAEVNVLTRSDDRIIDELSYLTPDEAADMKKRLGAFSGDTTLNQFKAGLQRTVSAPYPTSMERDLAMLSQIGISTNTRSSGGASYDPSRLRGYLEIDERGLDAALETKMPAIKELFGSDSDGDLISDTGIAVHLDTLTRPFVETGGIVTLKTSTLDSRISRDQRRIDTMERQLAAKETELKIQYGRMEGAYARMEQMSASLENFSQRANNNR